MHVNQHETYEIDKMTIQLFRAMWSSYFVGLDTDENYIFIKYALSAWRM